MRRLDSFHVDVTYHKPEEGVLFWGGPWHGKVVPQDERTMSRGRVRVPHTSRTLNLKASTINHLDPLAAILPTAAYSVHTYTSPVYADNTAEIWYVLIYQERDDRLIQNLEATVKALMWLFSQVIYVKERR